jgi:hypothetical protein
MFDMTPKQVRPHKLQLQPQLSVYHTCLLQTNRNSCNLYSLSQRHVYLYIMSLVRKVRERETPARTSNREVAGPWTPLSPPRPQSIRTSEPATWRCQTVESIVRIQTVETRRPQGTRPLKRQTSQGQYKCRRCGCCTSTTRAGNPMHRSITLAQTNNTRQTKPNHCINKIVPLGWRRLYILFLGVATFTGTFLPYAFFSDPIPLTPFLRHTTAAQCYYTATTGWGPNTGWWTQKRNRNYKTRVFDLMRHSPFLHRRDKFPSVTIDLILLKELANWLSLPPTVRSRKYVQTLGSSSCCCCPPFL